MKKIVLLLAAVSIFGCTKDDDGYCNCEPPPGNDEILHISLLNANNENLLSENSNGYLRDSLFTFYLLKNDQVSNLTQLYKNSSFFENFGTEENPSKQIVLNYSWLLNSNNTKEGSYVINYGNSLPNDTIYLKYQITEREDSDKILEVKLNGLLQETESIDGFYRKLVLVK